MNIIKQLQPKESMEVLKVDSKQESFSHKCSYGQFGGFKGKKKTNTTLFINETNLDGLPGFTFHAYINGGKSMNLAKKLKECIIKSVFENNYFVEISPKLIVEGLTFEEDAERVHDVVEETVSLISNMFKNKNQSSNFSIAILISSPTAFYVTKIGNAAVYFWRLFENKVECYNSIETHESSLIGSRIGYMNKSKILGLTKKKSTKNNIEIITVTKCKTANIKTFFYMTNESKKRSLLKSSFVLNFLQESQTKDLGVASACRKLENLYIHSNKAEFLKVS